MKEPFPEDFVKLITSLAATAAIFLSGGVAAQTPALALVAPAGGTTFVQVRRLLADPTTGVVQRDKTLVIRGNRIVEVRAGSVSDEAGRLAPACRPT